MVDRNENPVAQKAFLLRLALLASAMAVLFVATHVFAQSNSLEQELIEDDAGPLSPDEQKFLNEEYKPPKEAPYTEESTTSSETEPIAEATPAPSPDAEPLKESALTSGEATEKFEQSGLRKVTAKGEYIYDTPESPIDWGFRFKIRPFAPTSLSNNLSNGTRIYFTDLYGKTAKLMFDFDIEYLLLARVGKLYLTAGTGLLTADGHGRFKRDSSIVSREKYSLYLAPNRLGARYAFDYGSKQFLIPYAYGGGYYFTFLENRDDGVPNKYGGAGAVYGGGGLAFRLDALAKNNAMDAEYGINHVHIFAEAEQIVAASEKFDFGGQYLSGGLLFEF